MPFEEILNEIVSCAGVESAIFLDSQGEAIFWCGRRGKDELHLVGAYQGIILSALARLGLMPDSTIVTLCQDRSILTRHLKDGYFVCVVLLAFSNFAQTQFQLQPYFCALEKEL